MHANFHIKKMIIRRKRKRMLTRKMLKISFLPRKVFILMKIIKAHMMIKKTQTHILTLATKYLFLLKINQLVNWIVVRKMNS